MEKFVEKGFIGNGRFYLDGRRIGNASTAKISYTVEQKHCLINKVAVAIYALRK